MDILSDILTTLRTGRPSSVRTQGSGHWGLRFRTIAGAGFHVVLQGSCLLLPPAAAPIRLGPGDLVFLRKGSGHTICDDLASPVEEFVPERDDPISPIGRITVGSGELQTVLLCGAYQLDVNLPHPLLAELPHVLHLPAVPGRYPSLRAAIDQLSVEVERPRPGSDSIVASLVDLLLLYVLRAWHDQQPADESGGWAAALADPVLASALHAIHNDPGFPWTVESLGQRAGLSRAAFARRFTAMVGEPPLTYLTNWRMTTAARLLRETDGALSSIAKQTGYSSEFAFAKAFKRRYGTAPGGYRRDSRAAEQDAVRGPDVGRSRRAALLQ